MAGLGKIRYTGQSHNGPSNLIWHDCPWLEMLEDPGLGYVFWDDFLNFSQHISIQNTQQYSSYVDTGVTIKSLATAVGGVIEVAANDADNDEGSIQVGGNSGVMGVISDTAADAKKMWFEARIKKASIADNALAFFVGLGEENLAAENTLIDNTGEFAAKDCIGFRVKHDNGEELDFVYGKAATPTEVIANIKAMVADTYVKVGFKYDPDEIAAKRIKIYHDNVEQSTYVTGTNIAAATFPDAEEMGLLLATKVGAAAESKLELDWWRFAQLR